MVATLALTLLFALAPGAKPAAMPDMAAKTALAAAQYSETRAAAQYSEGRSNALYITPTDDVWVYAHAGDPQRDAFLRAWGANGRAVPLPGDDPQAYSYSLLRWDLSGFPKNARIASAHLVLMHAPEAGFTNQQSKEAPLQVRLAKNTFVEKNWDYTSDAVTFAPGGADTDVLGSASVADVPTGEFPIAIDLMQGAADFRRAFNDAIRSKRPFIALAITSAIDPSKLGMTGVYRVYSKDTATASYRPALRIRLER